MFVAIKQLFDDLSDSNCFGFVSETKPYELLWYGMIFVPVILFLMTLAIVAVLFFAGLFLALGLDLIFKLTYFKFKKPSYLEYTDYNFKEL